MESKPVVKNGTAAVKTSPAPALKALVAKSTFSPRVRRKSAGRRFEPKAEVTPGMIASAAKIGDPTGGGTGGETNLGGRPESTDVPGGFEKGIPGPGGEFGAAPSADPKVVIVSAEADPLTRAQPAVEVDKKNVVFGG
jgi:hypothetical protein